MVKGTPSINEIKHLVSKRMGVTQRQLVSAQRSRPIVRPRQIAMYLCSRYTKWSLPNIGRAFGNRDHTTVIYAIGRVEDMIEKKTVWGRAATSLEREIDATVFTVSRHVETVTDDIIDDALNIIRKALQRAAEEHPIEVLESLTKIAKAFPKEADHVEH